MRWTLCLALMLSACKKDDDDNDNGGDDTATEGCDLADSETCGPDEVCEEVVGDVPACFAPLTVAGRVFDTSDDAAIPGALVVARDANGAAISSVAQSDADGTYALNVPAPRDADGTPVLDAFTLRADAAGFLSYPSAPRSALPIDLAEADDDGVLDNAATDIGLIGSGTLANLGTVQGRVDDDAAAGTLIVAGGSTAVADRDGEFTVFNVSPGSIEVSGYQVGLNLSRATVDVAAGEVSDGVLLTANGEATATVSGTVQIVNAPGDSSTSVILVLEDTFDPGAIRGEAPPGLRAGDINGDWAIEGVPDGRYVVLAAFENDLLVRDPDTSIGGTDIVTIEVSGADQAVDGFKVTEALAVISPGADGLEVVSGPVTLSWEDDSSEDNYEVAVFDALGNEVWSTSGDFDPGGNNPVEVAYEGPLQSGMIYQFKATSMKSGVPLSTTEDLTGVFQVQ